jgi:hypothetical protein
MLPQSPYEENMQCKAQEHQAWLQAQSAGQSHNTSNTTHGTHAVRRSMLSLVGYKASPLAAVVDRNECNLLASSF